MAHALLAAMLFLACDAPFRRPADNLRKAEHEQNGDQGGSKGQARDGG
jgi:hypothetical protein